MPDGVEICAPSDPQIPENPNAAADFDDFDSACSTPYVSAPSSPGRCPPPGVGFFYYSAPTSPVHFILSSTQIKSSSTPPVPEQNTSFEFELHAAAGSTSSAAGSMSSADELFLNGQIRPMKLSSHLQRPQALAPLLDLDPHGDGDDDDDDDDDKNANTKVNAAGRGRDNQMMLRDRSKSLRRRARSMSPLRSSNNNSAFQWLDDLVDDHDHDHNRGEREGEIKEEGNDGATSKDPVDIPAAGGTSSRSSSAGRSSRRWVFLKEFLYRSKSEGRSSSSGPSGSGSGGHKFWSSFSASSSANSNSSRDDKDREKRSSSSSTTATTTSSSTSSTKKGGKKRVVVRSAHELHYTTNRAQAEEMRKKTYLPYRQGLLGCLGFSSKSYGALNGFARALNPVSSR